MSTALERTWHESSSFRSAALSLIELGPDVLRAVTPETLNDPQLRVRVPSSFQEHPEAYTALLFLHRAVEQFTSVETMLELLEDLIGREDESAVASYRSIVPQLSQLLFRSPEELRERRRLDLQHSAIPTLEDIEVEVDFRLVPQPESDEETVQFVPVVLVRLSFDEPVLNGNDAFYFQAHPEVVNDLEEKVAELRRQLKRGSDALRDRLL